MKKIVLLSLFSLVFVLIGCQLQSTETTTLTTNTSSTTATTSSQTTITDFTTIETTTSTPYDPRGLVQESCQHLDNIDDWQPVWCDEFDVDGLPDSSKWLYDVGGHGWGNQESQYYTNADLDNARVEDGNLYITARKESMMGSEYTSARLISKYQGDWLYGRIQIRAKMPSGRGLWSAIWMLPTDWRYGDWPNSGEIDIMEYVGYDKDKIHGTIHTGAYNHNIGTQIGFSKVVDDVEDQFVLYEMIWEPGRIDLYIDGVKFAFFGYNPITNVDTENHMAWPFDQRFHLIMNIAVGGTWGGVRGIDDSIFPQSMVVDYVRVYQKDYAGMDKEVPSSISNLETQAVSTTSIKLKWNHATDDIMIKQYDVFVNENLYGSTTVNGILLTGLEPETEHTISIISVDFANNRSTPETIIVNTNPIPNILDVIQAEFYTSMVGIRVEDTLDEGGGKNVGWIDDGDTLFYLLRVSEEGNYRIVYRVASQNGGGEIRMFGYGIQALATTPIGATGGWQVWENVVSEEFYLAPGIYTFRLRASKGGFNLNWFYFEKVS